MIGLRASLGLVFFSVCSVAYGGHTEQRDYVIHIDGKESGATSMTIVQQDDGTCYMKAKVVVNFRKLVFSYTYQVEAEEWWKQDKLIGAKTSANDNGKKADVVARTTNDGLSVTVNNGQPRLLPIEAWTSSYWKLADAKFHNNKVTILETDTGRELFGKLEYVGTEQLPVAGTPTKVFRFKVTGIANPVDLWYDAYHRLVRQEFTEDGYKTIVHLSHIRR